MAKRTGHQTARPLGARSRTPRGGATPTAWIDRTLDVWQPRTCRALTREDARQITENVVGFLRVLLEWEDGESAVAPNVTGRDGAARPPVGKVVPFAPVACIR